MLSYLLIQTRALFTGVIIIMVKKHLNYGYFIYKHTAYFASQDINWLDYLWISVMLLSLLFPINNVNAYWICTGYQDILLVNVVWQWKQKLILIHLLPVDTYANKREMPHCRGFKMHSFCKSIDILIFPLFFSCKSFKMNESFMILFHKSYF